MQPHDVVNRSFSCGCGRVHHVPIRAMEFADDALERLPDLLRKLAIGASICIVADQRTYKAAGAEAEGILTAAGWTPRRTLVPDPDYGEPVCDDHTRNILARALLTSPLDLIIAVGSGVISDLCKWIATDTKIPYLTIATAASMNGYTSANIAPAIAGVKRVLRGVVPLAVVSTPALIHSAPDRLTAAGLGDVLAKPVSMTDWKINHLLFNDYYCPLCAEIVKQWEPVYMNHPGLLRRKEPATLSALYHGLLYSGIAMTLADTSAPASGGEHMISHVLDMTAGQEGISHDYHGRQVGLGTIFACALYEQLMVLDSPRWALVQGPTDKDYWKALTPVVEEEHALKRVKAAHAIEALRQPGMWERIRDVIRAGAVPADKIKHCLREAGAAHCLADIGCSRDRFVAAARHAHQIRERYTVIDLARAAGLLPGVIDSIVDRYLLA